MGRADWIVAALANMTVPEADLHLLGWGHVVPNDCTLETLAVLDRVATTFVLPPRPDLAIPGDVIDLGTHYQPGRPRHDVYREIADRILEVATRGAPIALLTFGSAPVGTAIVHHLLADGPARGLRVRVTPAVSSLEIMWGEVGIEPFNGVLIWDATAFFVNRAAPPPGVDLLLAGITVFDVFHTQDPYERLIDVDLRPLRDHLLQFFGEDHPVAFVQVATGKTPSRLHVLPLCELTDSPGDISTLYVPREPTWTERPSNRRTTTNSSGITRLDLARDPPTVRLGSRQAMNTLIDEHFTARDLLTPAECEEIRARIDALHCEWIRHHDDVPLHTLGISGFLTHSRQEYETRRNRKERSAPGPLRRRPRTRTPRHSSDTSAHQSKITRSAPCPASTSSAATRTSRRPSPAPTSTSNTAT